MALDLETLRAEMQAHLDESKLAVFHGYHRMLDSLIQVYWDTEGHPDFREFLATARKAGAKLIVFHYQAFSLDQIQEALDQLEDADFTREEKRNFETRLRQLQAYEGFTCSLELSFSLEGHIYLYEQHTDWYQSLNDILAELDAAIEIDEDEADGLDEYFSKN
ncbi:MAG: hypothetical protein JOZ22_18120 [Acidobacteriia bacterium]|nr:hypothetical protein [Terriglobia bacterium]